jgi:hypothetical protein
MVEIGVNGNHSVSSRQGESGINIGSSIHVFTDT